MKKIEKKQLIVIILSIIIGIIAVTAINLNSSVVKIAFTEPRPTQKDYDILKGYVWKVANGEDFNKNEEIEIDKKVEEEALIIKVEIPNQYGVEVRFPLSNIKNLEIENGHVVYNAIIDYDNAMYIQYCLIRNKITFIFMDLLLISIIAIIPYVLFYWSPKEWKKVNKKIEE